MSQIDQAAGAAIVERLGRGTRHLGMVRASDVFLEQLLQLPDGHRITSGHWDSELQAFVFAVEGPAMPEVAHGNRVPIVRPIVRRAIEAEPRLQVTWPDCRPPLRSVR